VNAAETEGRLRASIFDPSMATVPGGDGQPIDAATAADTHTAV
jgi:hypothetical protein